ncbi:MAG: UvrD-helicase domain-containing protein [Chloroherpetonaceae bacterium]|nr:UvrD-helicase domain-containing protein [Chloroherpetonaceae bacterium]MDW8437398.1 3'-5' exonuclease [Chloroherpetonaceae bacterium]
MNRILDGLTEEQREAAEHLRGGLLTLAPVGTGKTETIARRAAFAISSGVAPEKILCLTFTNKAASEMKARIQKLLGDSGYGDRARDVTVSTFHSLCAKILRREAESLAISPDFLIYDEEDSIAVVSRERERFALNVAPHAERKLDRALFHAIQRAKIEPYQTDSPEPLQKILYRCLNSSGLKEDEIDLRQNFFAQEIFDGYHSALRESDALDFNDLLAKTLDLFKGNPDALSRWQETYEWIQVDEVQDTSIPEYEILSRLASVHKNLAFFGDAHQTIFEWRDSNPSAVLLRFERDFAPIKKVELSHNHRSTANILQAALSITNPDIARLLEDLSEREIKRRGEKVKLRMAQSLADESYWIAGEVRRLHENEGVAYSDFAIITRRHELNEKIAECLRFCQIPHYLVEDSKFFARPEVKDALAHLRLLLNPNDEQAFRRVALAVPSEMSEDALDDISRAIQESGLRLRDFLNPQAREGDVFKPLLDAFERDGLVAIDMESTGLNPYQDEAIEVAAVKFGKSGKVAEFHRFIKPTKPVGDSEKVHGISDAFLQENGRDPKIVFGALLDFIGDSVLVGHNIGFDLDLLKSNLRRLELDLIDFVAFDTLDLSRRYAKLRDYKLLTVCRHYGISLPTHRAMDDANAVAELVRALAPTLQEGARLREQHLFEHRASFDALARLFERWQKQLEDSRPQVLLERVLSDRELREHWRRQKDGNERVEALNALSQRFSVLDLDRKENPKESLKFILENATLGFGGSWSDPTKLPILTAHQAKGMEFQVVFIAGATDREFPHWLNHDPKGVEQERKLLYVAMTRAKRRLYISYFARNEKDYKQKPSRFIQQIPHKLIEPV